MKLLYQVAVVKLGFTGASVAWFLSGGDDVIGEPEGEVPGDDGFRCTGQVICI